MAQLVRKTFTLNGTFTPPAGVKNVNVKAIRKSSLLGFGMQTSLGDNDAFTALDAFGNLWMCGQNAGGQLGDGTATARSSPTLVVGGLKFLQYIANANSIYCLDQFGNPYGFGANTAGQLGTNDLVNRSSPTLMVGGLKFASLGQLANINGQFQGITPGGDMWMTGLNASGQLGNNTVTATSSPVKVVGGLIWDPNPKKFGAAGGSACSWGISTAGLLYMWGSNSSGQLGVGDILARSSPTLVVGGLTWAQAAILDGANNSSYGITQTGQMYAWGQNTNGQLGDGTVTNRSSPVLVVGGLLFSQFVTESTSTGQSVMAVTTSGQLYAWGANTNGQLGVGDVVPRSSPTLVLGGLTVAKVMSSAGNSGVNNSFHILTTTGQMYCCGFNTNGGLGTGDTTPRSSPTLVVGGLTFVNMGTDQFNQGVRALATTGQLYSWGGNPNGQLGVGDVTARSSPTLVLGGLSVASQDLVVETPVSLTPGTNYSLVMQQAMAFLGSIPLGNGPFDQIVIEYWQ